MNQDHSIHSRAEILGFDRCGIARCRPLEERRGLLERWLAQGRHGGLTYMERNLDKRIDPALLVEGARSVVVCAISYNSRLTERLVCPGTRLPSGIEREIARTARLHSRPASRNFGTRLRRYGPDPRKKLGRRSGSRTHRTPLATDRTRSGIVRCAGADRDGCRTRTRSAFPGTGPVRFLPRLYRSLPRRCDRKRPDDRRFALYLAPHDRGGSGRRRRPARVDIRLRHLPAGLPPQPPCTGIRPYLLRPGRRYRTDDRNRLAAALRNRFPKPFRRHAAGPLRTGAYPTPHPARFTKITSRKNLEKTDLSAKDISLQRFSIPIVKSMPSLKSRLKSQARTAQSSSEITGSKPSLFSNDIRTTKPCLARQGLFRLPGYLPRFIRGPKYQSQTVGMPTKLSFPTASRRIG